ncbi:28S ribosomal protein S6, mitochondrial [Coelomomyces lativittatus]|nr:28S ribosomal protein S6, mitochondrial [Coelomomyces lativittatus]KAJ1503759.1 28S ribosomal protein S6, mitochondrial [Coelomomyces lativittatus]KAJ1504829.1 28S ribosomal protein S6, mitochondrial [Coelomomyces lativittatus]
MPLYEMVIIAKPSVELVRPFLKSTILTILNRGGVVRSIHNLLERELPYRMKAHQQFHTQGHYCTIQFDTPSDQLKYLKQHLSLDSRVIRATLIKLGDSLTTVSGLNPHYMNLRKPLLFQQEAQQVQEHSLETNKSMITHPSSSSSSSSSI